VLDWFDATLGESVVKGCPYDLIVVSDVFYEVPCPICLSLDAATVVGWFLRAPEPTEQWFLRAPESTEHVSDVFYKVLPLTFVFLNTAIVFTCRPSTL
jgi:hypothetical protein